MPNPNITSQSLHPNIALVFSKKKKLLHVRARWRIEQGRPVRAATRRRRRALEQGEEGKANGAHLEP